MIGTLPRSSTARSGSHRLLSSPGFVTSTADAESFMGGGVDATYQGKPDHGREIQSNCQAQWKSNYCKKSSRSPRGHRS